MHANYTQPEHGRVRKLKQTALAMFEQSSGRPLKHALLPSTSVESMEVLESKKFVLLLARGDNSLLVVDYYR